MNKPYLYRFFRIGLLGALALAIVSPTRTQRVFAQGAQSTSDLSIQMVADRDKVRFGENVTYTVTMTNLGPDDAIFADVTFELPDQLALVSMTCDLGISADTPACEYASLPSGTTVVSTLTATPNAGLRGMRRVVTTTAVASFEMTDVVDPDNANNTALLRTKIVGKLPRP